MHTRRLATLILGAWLGASLFLVWIATDNFASVGRVMNTTSAKGEKLLKEIGADRAQAILRYHTNEQNRSYFDRWGWVQIAISVLLAITLLFATNGNKLVMTLAGAMLSLTVIMQLTTVPQIIGLGRVLDFAPPGEFSEERRVFIGYHRSYAAMEGAKLLLGVALGVKMLFSGAGSRRRRRGVELDVVDHTDYGHINR